MVCACTGCVLSKLQYKASISSIVQVLCLGLVWFGGRDIFVYPDSFAGLQQVLPMHPSVQGHPLRMGSTYSQVSSLGSAMRKHCAVQNSSWCGVMGSAHLRAAQMGVLCGAGHFFPTLQSALQSRNWSQIL